MRRAILVLVVVAVAACGLLEPDEFWCSQTHYFTEPDSGWADPADSAAVGVEPDSVVTVWSEDGVCPDTGHQ